MKMYDAVLLDLYDTLAWVPEGVLGAVTVDRTGIDAEAFRLAIAATRDERSVGAYPTLEDELAAALSPLGVELAPDRLADLAVADAVALAIGVRLYDDALATIERLRWQGIRTVLVSNCSRATRRVVRWQGLEDLMDEIVLSFEVGSRKPDDGIFRAAIDAAGVDPDRALFVDDMVTYLDGAAALGIGTVQIVRENVERREGPHPRITGLGELERFIDPAA